MAHVTNDIDLPVIRDPKDFDAKSGGRLERLVFNNRLWVVILCLAITAVLGYRALQLQVSANFDQMIPVSHPYIKNYQANRDKLRNFGDSVRIVVERTDGDIYDRGYLEVVRKINDKVYLTRGVDRAGLKSVWTPATRWTEITEEGYRGGPVMPFDYDGSAKSIADFRQNVARAGLVGSFVGTDQRSSVIFVPLLDKDPETGKPISYTQFASFLEHEVRPLGGSHIKIHIVGFAKLVGDLIDGLRLVLSFFAVSALIAALVIYAYTRDLRSTVLLVVTSVCGVIWLLGLLQILGFDLNPYSILVPFLIFAIGLSHGAQKMNGIMQDVGRGTHKYVAARYTFRRLFLAGLTALMTNVVGFAVLMIIDIPVIKQLALATSMGVLILIFTKLFFIPVALSYIGVSRSAAERSLRRSSEQGRGVGAAMLRFLEGCTERRRALPLVLVSLAVGIAAATLSLTSLKIGDMDAGAPELRPDSRYNRDVAYINAHYGLSGDQFVIMMKTKPGAARGYDAMVEQDRLVWMLSQLRPVLAVTSLSNGVRQTAFGAYEGNPKWMTLPRNEQSASLVANNVVTSTPEVLDGSESLAPVAAYLRDHKADTLTEVVRAVEAFAAQHDTPDRQFLLAAGSAGIEAATNIVVKQANYRMLALLYAAVAALCFITFRSWRAVIVAMVPLLITSFLCEALMILLGIGVKVATLPVIALGVGVGVDYALYLLSVQLAAQRRGASLREAYAEALHFTGKIVALIGVTMAVGVVTWAMSPIKFQADMGILLTFMFIWNMIASLLLIPALSRLLFNPKTQPKAVREVERLA